MLNSIATILQCLIQPIKRKLGLLKGSSGNLVKSHLVQTTGVAPFDLILVFFNLTKTFVASEALISFII